MHGLLHGHNYAKAAIDIAMHDLLGKAYGLRVCDMLGGAGTDQVDSYWSLTVDDPDETARVAAQKIAEGYPRLQVKIGGRPVEIDIKAIRKVWEATGCTRLVVDANRALLTRDVLRIDRERAAPLRLGEPGPGRGRPHPGADRSGTRRGP
jgi:L-alanine-DL-glutamate epimerase-like enolase superfamily enzyme